MCYYVCNYIVINGLIGLVTISQIVGYCYSITPEALLRTPI